VKARELVEDSHLSEGMKFNLWNGLDRLNYRPSDGLLLSTSKVVSRS